MSDLRFAPWLTEGSKGVPADRPVRPFESMESKIGLVVLVQEPRTDQRIFGVITDVTDCEDARWFWIVANGTGRWLHEQQVRDWEPVCPQCGRQRWWWTEDGTIHCGTCHPPTPGWVEAWRLLAALTSGFLPQDEQTAIILAMLEAADHAYLSNDWPRFQRVIARVRALQFPR